MSAFSKLRRCACGTPTANAGGVCTGCLDKAPAPRPPQPAAVSSCRRAFGVWRLSTGSGRRVSSTASISARQYNGEQRNFD